MGQHAHTLSLQIHLAFIHCSLPQHLLNVYYNHNEHSPYIQIAYSPLGEMDTWIKLDSTVQNAMAWSGARCYSDGRGQQSLVRKSFRKLRAGGTVKNDKE